MATIMIPDAVESARIAGNKKAHKSDSMLVDSSQKVLCPVLGMAPGATPSDYAALKTALEAINGVQWASLPATAPPFPESDETCFVDGQTYASVAEGKRIRLYLRAGIRREDVPEE